MTVTLWIVMWWIPTMASGKELLLLVLGPSGAAGLQVCKQYLTGGAKNINSSYSYRNYFKA